MKKRPPSKVGLFEEALEWFRSKTPMTGKAYKALSARAKRKAFGVSGVANLRMSTDVWEALDRAISHGTTLEQFKQEMSLSLEAAWGGSVANPPWRMETIFRTNLQHAYGAGRYQQLTEPGVANLRPYWQLQAVMDKRTTMEICAKLDGAVVEANAPWWRTHTPPLHYNCRTVLVGLSAKAGEAAGGAPSGPSVAAQEGFGLAPDRGEWSPDVDAYPAPLRRAFRRKR